MIVWCPRLLARDSKETPRKPGLNDLNKNLSEVKDYSYRDVPGFLVLSLFCGLLAPLHTMLCSWASKKRAGPRHYDGVSSLSHNPTYGIMMYYVLVDQHTNTDNIDNIDYVIVYVIVM